MSDHKSNEQYEGWKKSMTDYQFKHLLALIEKVDVLTHENEALREECEKLKQDLSWIRSDNTEKQLN